VIKITGKGKKARKKPRRKRKGSKKREKFESLRHLPGFYVHPLGDLATCSSKLRVESKKRRSEKNESGRRMRRGTQDLGDPISVCSFWDEDRYEMEKEA